MKNNKKITPDWLVDADVQKLFDVLENGGEQNLYDVLEEGGEHVRIVGGAVRNYLIGSTIKSDVDFAVTTKPEETMARLEAAGIRVVPTGIDHGTVTAVLNGVGYEITTLRRDIETDGRHAVVAFGSDFEEDAKRRDFTINALYVDRQGVVYDYVDGLSDIESMSLRFIGDANERIKEDYLRILRFFRFFAWFGKHRPDADGLKASMRLKDGIKTLSAERIWAEMHKLFSAPDPSRALLWMRQVGVLTLLLPESEKWGIDAIPPLMEAECAHNWPVDPLIRLMAIVPKRQNSVNDIATRWRLSNAQRDRMRAWAALPAQLPKDEVALRALAYRHSKQAIIDGLYVQTAMQRDNELAGFAQRIAAWKMPQMPVKGVDLLERGFEKGPNLGGKLKQLEDIWIESDFTLERSALLEQT